MARHHAQAPAPSAGTIITDTLEMVACTGAQQMLQRALEDEVQTFLGRDRYAPGGRDAGYRNGHGRPREIGNGSPERHLRRGQGRQRVTRRWTGRILAQASPRTI